MPSGLKAVILEKKPMAFQFQSVRQKFTATILLMALISCVSGALSYYLFRQNNALHQTQLMVNQLEKNLQQATQQQTLFQLRGRKKETFYIQQETSELLAMDKSLSAIDATLSTLEKDEMISDQQLQFKINRLWLLVGQYASLTTRLSKAYLERGYKSYGLEGQMREAAHALEKSKFKTDQIFLLTLRRHEKDYMLRGEKKYIESLHKTAETFLQQVDQNGDAARKSYQNAIKQYVRFFDQIVKVDTQIGQDTESGIRKEIEMVKARIHPIVAEIETKITERNQQLKTNSQMALALFIIINLLAGCFCIFFISKKVTASISRLNKAVGKVMIEDISTEEIERQFDDQSRDEIGSLNRSFKKLMLQIKQRETENKAQTEALEAAAQEDQNRQWIVASVNELHRLFKETDGINTLCKNILKYIIDTAQLNQGALFVKQTDEDASNMELRACYAYNREKFISEKYELGEGLVGTVWQEEEAMYMTDIPADYVKITSGLGHATPKHLYITPLLHNGTVEGVLELASLTEISPTAMAFIQQATGLIASIINSVRIQEDTHRLLRESQSQAEELKAQEEELRQNMEELEATQEEMRRLADKKSEEIEQWRQTASLKSLIIDEKKSSTSEQELQAH